MGAVALGRGQPSTLRHFGLAALDGLAPTMENPGQDWTGRTGSMPASRLASGMIEAIWILIVVYGDLGPTIRP
jgi:hypothetical protein